jgi:hypothetical protein
MKTILEMYRANLVINKSGFLEFWLPEDAFDLMGREGSKVHTPTEGAASLAFQLVSALFGIGFRVACCFLIRRYWFIVQFESA